MQKIVYSFIALLIFTGGSINARQVEPDAAQQVARNFLFQNARVQVADIALAHTERSAAGFADYYVFTINNNTGFVIVSADDAGLPIIGYSTESTFAAPTEESDPFYDWMTGRKAEIEYLRDNNVQANPEIVRQWTDYSNIKNNSLQKMSTAHGPLISTLWTQNSPYNSMCPGGSLTGCVATSMAQIMKYWKFPTKGTGSSSYSAPTYGTQSANYGATTYNWANMPLTSANTDVATIMYHCGVSVEMKYAPSTSGAQVYSAGGNAKPCSTACAQCAYQTYFGYDPAIYTAFQQYAPSVAVWISTIEGELAAGRPIQYFAQDPSKGAHSWVCDGNDAADKMHMVWGWPNGQNNGYYDVNSLTPPPYNFSAYKGALFNIKPKGSTTGVQPMSADADFKIYPNPAVSEVIIEGASHSDKIHYSLCNMLGSEISAGEISSNGNSFSGKISVSDFTGGMYFLKVTDGDSSFTKKLSKQ